MPTLLIHNAHTIATQDDARSELRHASILVRDHTIAYIGPADGLPADALNADEVIDARRHLVTPGLVNT
ncbi:MAG: 8-oxoguanine deaminase, partial [Rhodoferax sp.]|nr:8-oxoguanine deaminase [Rhodoferax sp.]